MQDTNIGINSVCAVKIGAHQSILDFRMYRLARPLLFRLEPETAHQQTLRWLDFASSSPLTRPFVSADAPLTGNEFHCMGLAFPGRIGLAAGLDKNGDHIDSLGTLGFGFIEIGTVTPRPQQGNPKPRLFRLPGHRAIINRMGFNNLGVDHLVGQAAKRRYKGILGINIGKNAATPLEQAHQDYLTCLKRVYPVADYITVNISSPNTPGLRDLQHGDHLRRLFDALKQAQSGLANQHGHYRPIAVKIAPDITESEIEDIAAAILDTEIDGVIATNTSSARPGVEDSPLAEQAGGLSGEPICRMSTRVIHHLGTCLAGRVPIIGAGGIHDIASAAEKIAAGAQLLQIYTGLIYQGPSLLHSLNQASIDNFRIN